MKIKKLKLIKKLWKIFILLGLVLGITLVWLIFNNRLRNLERNVEVTFISPHQAIVFWKTNSQSLGYLKSGLTKHQRQTKTYQTSSEASNIHAVFLENIPVDGLYISIHNEDDSPLYLAKIMHINYQPMDLELEP